MLQRLFQKYSGWLRNLKAVYVLNNMLNADRLRPNRDLYRRFGVRKSIFSPLGSRDFPTVDPQALPWLDQPDALLQVEKHPDFQTFDAATQEQIRTFITDGYLVLSAFFPQEKTDALNADVDRLLAAGQAEFNYTGRKIFNLHESSPLADAEFFRSPEILRLLSFLLGRPLIPFQSLGFTLGSEQRVHSDSIHMSTAPPGFMIATWIALEDCTPENGPLVYYPGSHRLPYLSTGDYDSGNTALTIGENSNRRYEDRVATLLQEKGLEPKSFLGRRGDVLVWHANLLHGGSPITRAGATRRSMVCHYFAQGVICYHEMSQRPALLPKH